MSGAITGACPEIEIPFSTDSRTMEQCRYDMLQSLALWLKIRPNVLERDSWTFRYCWTEEMHFWIEETYNRWNEDMLRMHRHIFTLLPVRNPKRETSVPFRLFNPFHHLPPILQQMQRELNTLRYHQGHNSGPAPPSFDFVPPSPRPLIPYEQWPGEALGFLTDAYEIGKEGKLYFKVRFKLQGFRPEDIKVVRSTNCLTVKGKKNTEINSSSSTGGHYSRTIFLPYSVQHSPIEGLLTSDGILMLEAPVYSPLSGNFAFTNDRQLSLRPRLANGNRIRSFVNIGTQIIRDGPTGKMLHVEFLLNPEHDNCHLLVRVDHDKLILSSKTQGRGLHYKFSEELIQIYQTSVTLDLISVDAVQTLERVIVETPLLVG